MKKTGRSGRKAQRAYPAVLWFTGLSGAGKSTIADRVEKDLQRLRIDVERLDGDQVRSLFPGTGFTREDRHAHLLRVGHIAALLEKHNVTVIASFVSPYRVTRREVGKLCRRFVEIHVSTPLDVCERRDPKGLYKLARAGTLKLFTGISDPYEPPRRPDLVLDTSMLTVAGASRKVVDYLLGQ